MTQILTPLLDKIKTRKLKGRDASQLGMNFRMCWTCQTEKPIKGGKFPEQKGNGGSRPVERFRCADCTARLVAKREAEAQKT